MLSKELLEKIRKDLKPLENYNVVIFGSVLRDDYIEGRSDIDVAVVTMKDDVEENKKILFEILPLNRKPYDIKIFELLPLGVRFEIIKNYEVLFGNPVEIAYYFYKYWKLYKDMKPRMERERIRSFEEIKKGIIRRKKLKEG